MIADGRKRWPILFAVVVALFTVLPAVSTIHESFWIDELHSVWTLQAPWSELWNRASAGNQSVLYFALIKGVINPSHPDEWIVRLPSALLWWIAFGIGLFGTIHTLSQRPSIPWPSLWLSLLLCSLMASLDWVSWFQAIEARPYAFALLGTSCMMASVLRESQENRLSINVVWMTAASLSVWLHPVSGLAVIASWLGRMGMATSRGPFSVASRCLELVMVTVSWLPILALGNTLYERRNQWSSMSGNVGLGFMLQHFPILPWLALPLLSFLILPKPVQAMRGTAAPSDESRRMDWRVQLLCVALVPLALGWLATQCGWLPIMHRRYLLAAHLAMFLLACTSLLQIRSWKVQLPFGVLVIATLVVQQGNWRHWQEGEWMGWQRFEGWDEAITELNRRVQPTDAICLAPFLIETRDEPFPLREPAEYYEFAVRSAYPLTSPSPCKILSNNVRHWPTELRQEKTNSVWICARSRLGPIVSQLRQLQTRDSKWPWKIQETLEFGRVQLIHLSRSETHIASP